MCLPRAVGGHSALPLSGAANRQTYTRVESRDAIATSHYCQLESTPFCPSLVRLSSPVGRGYGMPKRIKLNYSTIYTNISLSSVYSFACCNNAFFSLSTAMRMILNLIIKFNYYCRFNLLSTWPTIIAIFSKSNEIVKVFLLCLFTPQNLATIFQQQMMKILGLIYINSYNQF